MRRLGWLLAAVVGAAGAATARGGAPDWAIAVLPVGSEFSLEVAADPAARQRGYMFREAVAQHEGMIFVFDEMGRHGMWMKNCRVSLDLVWLDDAFRVRHIEHDLPPCPPVGECPTVNPPVEARFVIEFAGGTARREGLQAGDTVVVLADRPLR